MKKNGFTLIELLAVLTLLAFVALITVPVMESILESSKKKTKDASIKEIISATKKYVTKYPEKINFDTDNEFLLPVNILKSSEFLNDENYIDPETKKPFSGSIYIKYNPTKYTYTYSYFYKAIETNDVTNCFMFSNGTITGYNNDTPACVKQDIEIPTTINGIKVRKIENPTSSAKQYLVNARKVDFSKALYLDEILNNAFNKTTGTTVNMDYLDLSNNSLLQSIGDSAFGNTGYLNIYKLSLPDNIETIGYKTFRDNNIAQVTLPNKLERIGEEAFAYNKIERIEIPTNVRILSNNCFSNNLLKSVIINSKKDTTEFSLYRTPFSNNENFTDSKIIWKQ
ncbi:MAG: leucine-rich repeat protein [Bacilli bacterium]